MPNSRSNQSLQWYSIPEMLPGWRAAAHDPAGRHVVNESTSETFRLNDTGQSILELCNGEHTIVEIARRVSRAYTQPAERVFEEVREIIGRFREIGIVECENTGGSIGGVRSTDLSSGELTARYPDRRAHYDDPLRQCQVVMIRMLKIFDAICTHLDIDYFILDGTLLGALRHRGFIPFDGDVDVGMARADYSRFAAQGAGHLPEDMFLQDRKTDPGYPNDTLVKIRDRYSCYVEYASRHPEHQWHHGLQLDIFIHDVDGQWLFPEAPGAVRQQVRDVYPVGRLKFEDFFPMSPRYPESVISRTYPDYKDLPPANKRFPHEGRASATTACDHPLSLDWNNRESRHGD